MNGPVLGMYTVKPVFPADSKFFNNSSMYPVKAMLDSSSSINISDDQFKTVSERQNVILARISEIKECLRILRTMLDERQSLAHSKQGVVSDTLKNSITSVSDVTEWGTREIVVQANIEKPPFSLILLNLLGDIRVTVESHVHSSVKSQPLVVDEFNTLFKRHYKDNSSALKIRVIWKKDVKSTEVILGRSPVGGEPSLLRFVHRMHLRVDEEKEDLVQGYLDALQLGGPAALSELPSQIDSLYLLGQLTVLDIAAWSAILNLPNTHSLSSNLLLWFNKFDSLVKPLTVP